MSLIVNKRPGRTVKEFNIGFAQRSLSDELYKISSSLISDKYDRYQFKKTSALGYFLNICELPNDWVVNIDEDAFLTNIEALLDLIRYMNENDYGYCGVTETNINIRQDFSQIYPNAFFTVLNLKSIRNAFYELMNRHAAFRFFFTKRQIKRTRIFITSNRGEPYYPFFEWLNNHDLRYLNLPHSEDGMITIVKNINGVEFLKHAWFARGWKSPEHHWRYKKIFNQIGL